MEETGQLHDPATLTPRKACPITTDHIPSLGPSTGLDSEKEEKSLPLPGIETRFVARPSRSTVSVLTNRKLLVY